MEIAETSGGKTFIEPGRGKVLRNAVRIPEKAETHDMTAEKGTDLIQRANFIKLTLPSVKDFDIDRVDVYTAGGTKLFSYNPHEEQT